MPTYQPTLESLKQHPIPDWFNDAKFGIMIHWSVSSVPAWATPVGSLPEVTKKEGFHYWFSHNPYAEWYWNTLKIADSPTRQYHVKTFGDHITYPDFAAQFNVAAAKWDPAPWADLFTRVGARYVVLVSKHHDGFLLWPSQQRNPFRPDFCAERDIVGELTEAVRARGLRMGLYYSGGPDWWFEGQTVADVVDMANGIPQSPEYVRYVDAHWRELIERYQPSVLWNDIGFPAKLNVKALYADYYERVPDGVVNDRCIQADVRKLASNRIGRAILRFLVERLLTSSSSNGIPKTIHADFTTPEYASLKKIAAHKWETVRGVGYSFGYNQNETAEHMLSIEQLVHMLVDIVSKNGNLLLNLGPMADGTIPPLQLERVEGLGRWLAVNGEAIYSSRPWVEAESQTASGLPVRFTQKDGSLYVILLGKPSETEVRFPSLRFQSGTVVQLLGNDRPVTIRPEEAAVQLPGPLSGAPAYALKFTPAPEFIDQKS
jgi:alpha-L-fucosidase